jgi:hypothetical protein
MFRVPFDRLPARMLLALFGALPMAVAADKVEVTVINPVARESSPTTERGEFRFTRSGSAGSLPVYVRVRGGAVVTADYVFQGAATGATAITTGDGTSIASGFVVTFPEGVTQQTVLVQAVPDAPVVPPELGESVIVEIVPDSSYVTGSLQAAQVTIADGNVRLDLRVQNSTAEELLALESPVVGDRSAGGSFRFNFIDPDAKFASRIVGLSVNDLAPGGVFPSGAKLGITTVSNDSQLFVAGGDYGFYYAAGVMPAVGLPSTSGHALVQNPFAWRTIADSEYGVASGGGFDGYKQLPGIGGQLRIQVSGGIKPTDYEPGSYRLVYQGQTYTYTPNADPVDGEFALVVEDGKDYLLIDQRPTVDSFTVSIRFTDGFKTSWMTKATVTGTPPAIITTPGQAEDTNWQVAETVVYDREQGVTAVRIDPTRPVPRVGDVFQFSHARGVTDNQVYRVTGLETGRVFFYPALDVTISTTDGAVYLVTNFVANFRDTVTGVGSGRMAIHFPPMPTAPSPRYPTAQDRVNTDYILMQMIVIDDPAIEGAELSMLTLETSPDFDTLSPLEAKVVIEDDDVTASVKKTSDFSDAGEPDIAGTFTVTFSRPFDRPVNVGFRMSGPASFAGAFTDYTVQGLDLATGIGSISVPAGQTTAMVRINPVSDAVTEGAENVEITLLPSEEYILAGTSDGSDNAKAATLRIYDQIGTVSVVATVPTAQESAITSSQGIFTVSLARTATTATLVPFQITGGTSLTNSDFQLTFPTGVSGTYNAETRKGSITFSASATATDTQSATVEIRPGDDLEVETDEGVTLTLLTQPGLTISTLAVSAQVTILDDEPTLRVDALSPATEPTTAGATAPVLGQFRIRYGAGVPVGREVVVSYTVSGFDTAQPGVDYTPLSGVATISSSATFVDVLVTPVFDRVRDPNETVTITISTSTAYRVDMTANTARLLIREASTSADGGAAVVLSSASLTVDPELNAFARVQVNRLTINGNLTVTYGTVIGTAAAGTNYTPVSGQLNWPDQDSSPRFINIPVFATSATNTNFSLALTSPKTSRAMGETPVDNTIQGADRALITILGTATDAGDGGDLTRIKRDTKATEGCGAGGGIGILLALTGLIFVQRPRRFLR